MSLSDDIINTGTIPQVNASTLSDGIQLPGNAPSSNSSGITVPNPSWVEQNLTMPISNELSNLGLTSLGNFVGSLGASNNAITQATGKNANGTSASTSFWSDIFLRGVVIILGFIFVAIGLSMFASKGTTVIQNEIAKSYGLK